ncbi:putative DNA binding domain-containing protein [Desulforhopalus vacuolatus]|uniref:RNA-binding domain-containing protein n=1 Tax=Desulforhopalus vacuolatus TaxID=40414 RepID=UPI001964F52A|nr:RNA-binding domain-containing protein [Desulforhopalus vacuolatus]MBM9518327.1 putative DNA binding domain-containing protein [Desulforhopalus vacuolatus]
MNEKEILDLLKQHEWKDIEFKEAKTTVPKNAYESVSAFANTEGGYLVFGVKKDGSDFDVVGVIDVDKVQNDFLTALRQKEKFSSIIEVQEGLQRAEGKDLLIFYVPEVNRTNKPVYLNGNIKRSFLRKGACDVKCSDEELKRLLTDASKERYDGRTVDYDISKCFNSKDIMWYRRQYEGKAGNRTYADLSDEEFLFQFGLLKETPSGRKPTLASLLLFGQDGYLRGLLPRPVIDCQRYLYRSDSSDERRWHDRAVCDYNLVQSWTAIIEWYYRFAEIPFEVDPKTMQRKDQPVDYVAFREAIVNMLIHQDYSDHTRKPVIQHYKDLTRFWNPGDAFVSVSDLLEPGEKETRNPLIVTAFRRIGFSENAGWGLRDVFSSWRGLGHVPPELTNDKSKKSFELVLKLDVLLSADQLKFQKTIGVHLSEDEAAAFAYACKKQAPFLLSDIKGVLNKSTSACVAVVDQLVNQVLLSRIDENIFELAPVMKQRFQAEVQAGAQVDSSYTHDGVHDAESGGHDGVHDDKSGGHDELNDTERKILCACMNTKSTPELLSELGYTSRTRNYRTALSKLIDNGLVLMTQPDKPRSKSQKYVISDKGTTVLQKQELSGDYVGT